MNKPTFDTLELRWFVPGMLPEELVDWFSGDGTMGVVEHRVDTYWHVDRDDLGLKRRDRGVWEMKLLRDWHIEALPTGRTARVEQWSKWMPAQGGAKAPGAHVEIDKTIITRTFGPEGEVAAGPVDGSLPRTEVELAAILADDEPWWTLAFEASGPEALRPTGLASAVDTMFSPRLSDLVDDVWNLGYPAWLIAIRHPEHV